MNHSLEKIAEVYRQPFPELMWQAQSVHRQHHKSTQMQLSRLMSIKTGACPEDCGYCGQSGHFKTGVQKTGLLSTEKILEEAQAAKACGATRFCMGAAWRSPPKAAMPQLAEIIRSVKELGLETCMTLGMLDAAQAQTLAEAGLDYYNHNLDTSRSHYDKIVSTRSYEDRLATLHEVSRAGMAVCCGGILGLGESQADRIELIHTLANLPTPPASLPINRLMPMAGTPLADVPAIDHFEIVRCIATCRIFLPTTVIRLSAGRNEMSDELQALCYCAGANSIFVGDKLLTAPNPEENDDKALLSRLGLQAEVLHEYAEQAT